MAVTGTTRESSKAKARSKGPNAVTLLTQDHQEVKKLFQQYDKSKDKMSDAEKRKLSLWSR